MSDNTTIQAWVRSLPEDEQGHKDIAVTGGHTVAPEILESSDLKSTEELDFTIRTYFGPTDSPSSISKQPGDLWSAE